MSNPAVTFRVTPTDRERLENLTRKTGKSLGELLRENLGLAERSEAATYDRGWSEGYDVGKTDGIAEGKKAAFGSVYLECCVCKKTFLLNFYQNKEAASVLTDAFSRWGHGACLRNAR